MYGDHRELHVLTHSFPTRRSSDLLISEAYIREATTKQIDNSINGNHGYGYQIWIEQGGGFSFRGMGSQFAFCYPEHDFIFACIADTQGRDRKSTRLNSSH